MCIGANSADVNLLRMLLNLCLFQGGELIEETLSGNVTEDYTTLEFIKPDGTIISHLVDFKNVSCCIRVF